MEDEIVTTGTRTTSSGPPGGGNSSAPYTPDYSDGNGNEGSGFEDEEDDFGDNTEPEESEDEVITIGTRITRTSVEYYLPQTDYATIDSQDIFLFENVYDQMLEAFCTIAQDAINEVKLSFNISFDIDTDAQNYPAVSNLIAALSLASILFGDIAVSNTALGGSTGALVQSGVIPTSSISINDLLAGIAGSHISLGVFDEEGSRTLARVTPDGDSHYTLELNTAVASSVNTASIFGTIIHEFGHIFNLEGNIAPWDVDEYPGYHDVDTWLDIEHANLDELADLLASAVMGQASANNSDLMLNILEFLEECDIAL